MFRLQRIQVLLVAVIVVFVMAAIYISALVLERQKVLSQASRYSVVWPTSQATSEFARLEQRISAFGRGNAEPEEVQLRFDIIVNRFGVLQGGDLREFIASSPYAQKVMADFRRTVEAARPLIAGIGPGTDLDALLSILTPMDSEIARLAALANEWDAARISTDRDQLLRLHWTFSAISIGLIFCGMALIGLLLWQNKSLQQAQRALQALTTDLQATSDELTSTNAALRTQNARFDAALNNMIQALCMVDAENRLIVCNNRYVELFGLDPNALRPGTSIMELAERSSLGQSAGGSVLSEILRRQLFLFRAKPLDSYSENLSDGRTIAISHRPMADGGWVATYQDVTERRRAEDRIHHMAHHDGLTDLPNRLLLRQKMEEGLSRLQRYNQPFAILCLDLNRFKIINDTLGHGVGDALLQAVAKRLQDTVRETDVVARLGGDEFAILQLDADQPRSSDALARRIVEVLDAPYLLEGHQILVSTSIGIAIAPTDGRHADQLLRNADIALYRVKGDGRTGHRFFEQEMDAQLQSRRHLEQDLIQALKAGEFALHYQPLVDLASNQISECEALLRWHHPERGMVPPGEFIRVAEEIGLIIQLGEWVLQQACREAVSWPIPARVKVNLSPIQFVDQNLVRTVKRALEESGLPSSRLGVEITESVLLQNNEATLATLHELRQLGISIAMDDFGTGYSSLSYLRSFPFDQIKIDQSFIRDLMLRNDCRAIVDSIISLGHSLGMTTTAEGVELPEQVTELRKLGCDFAQGYLFGRPQPLHSVQEMLAAPRPPLDDAA
ncbi:diguanylate cyclase (GGDEF) domain-containing protein [Faunimonas pinastri]|uniref:Diguanylate cyclase (GGDEF) domain-containing protein n=1 Tax=Faunimonas pinastri TaxID=1855383 RepID=A0A1H9CNI6_9HYPH|nr:EAL domain-containing protein [Faunimonas pinastri]SEQ02233.1 diguanylate cyclase (GGDEF) domain-containing protein [Faunimonas pinastri]